jgi:CRISPR-associated protein Csd1
VSILASLAAAYERLPNAPPFGYSAEKISFAISLNPDGSVAGVHDIRNIDGKKPAPRQVFVPQAVKRTAGVAPNFLWDKTAYVLGVTAGEGKRTAEEHAAFVQRHLAVLAGTEDPGLMALAAFLKAWRPEQFTAPQWPEAMKDQNVVFDFEPERMDEHFLHGRPPAQALWRRVSAEGARDQARCLVSGEVGPVARLHPSIKGVWGAQSAGASIVSFNLDAFTSYGHEQGDNAPVSEAAAFAYTTALNRFLERDSGHRLQIGDASVVFWADARGADELAKAKAAEEQFSGWFGDYSPPDEGAEAEKVGERLKAMTQGRAGADLDPRLQEGVRFHVLALAPNAARLSVRFYLEDDFGRIKENYESYLQDIAFEPWPKSRPRPNIRTLESRTAPARIDASGRVKFDLDRISPLLSGELMRAILSNGSFPTALLGQILVRVRADHHLDSVRAALIKAVLVRNLRLDGALPGNKETYLVRSDPDDPNPARRLGRLFALIERAQLAALGDRVNATVKDKFLGAAAATPLQVFVPLIEAAETHHIKRLCNGHSDAAWIKNAEHARRVANGLKRDISRLVAAIDGNFPAQHSLEEQGYFLIGYYQERFGGSSKADGSEPDADMNLDAETDDQ